MAQLPQESSDFTPKKTNVINYLIKPDNRPSDLEYALMSLQVYQGKDLKCGAVLPGYGNWKIESICSGRFDYFGVLYVNSQTQQLVIAHRGTNSIGSILEDFNAIIGNGVSFHSTEAFALTQKVITLIKEGTYKGYHLSFTGHSLGGFIAGLCVFQCHHNFDINDVNAVTFECPGLKEKLESMQRIHEQIDIGLLDIINYVTYPNFVNTFGPHVGSLYSLEIDLGKWGILPIFHTVKSHSLENILTYLHQSKGKVKRKYQKNWPLGVDKSKDFAYTPNLFALPLQLLSPDAQHPKPMLQTHTIAAHYEEIDEQLSTDQSLPLRHFLPSMQTYLKSFSDFLNSLISNGLRQELVIRWKEQNIPFDIMQYLLGGYILIERRGIIILQLNLPNEDVFSFRFRLSSWLSQNVQRIDFYMLLATPSRSLNLTVANIGPGVQAEDSQVEELETVGIRMVIHSKKLASTTILNNIFMPFLMTNIHVYNIAANIRKTNIRRLRATGIEIKVVDSKIEDAPEQKDYQDHQPNGIFHIPGLTYQPIPGAGQCFYIAVGLYLNRSQELLREDVAYFLERNIGEFYGFIEKEAGQSDEDYIKGIRTGKEWGSNVEMEILMRIYQQPIVVLDKNCHIRNADVLKRYTGEPIFVFFDSDKNHYDAFVHDDEVPSYIILKYLEQFNNPDQPIQHHDISLMSSATDQKKLSVHQSLLPQENQNYYNSQCPYVLPLHAQHKCHKDGKFQSLEVKQRSATMAAKPNEVTVDNSIKADNRPSAYEYALMSQHVYKGSKLEKGDELPKTKGAWVVYDVQPGGLDYFGAIYVNESTKQIVVAHKGTDSFGTLFEDLCGIVLNGLSQHKKEVFLLVQKAIELAKKNGYHLSFTGHSLGGALAELCAFYCPRSFDYHEHVNAVTFESPGIKESLEKMQPNLEEINYKYLDIIGYVTYPNIVNTCNHHIGSLYSLTTDLGSWADWPIWYTKQAHTINNLVTFFEDKEPASPLYLTDWPMGSQKSIYFKYAELQNGLYKLKKPEHDIKEENKQHFSLDFHGKHHIDPNFSNQHTVALRHFAMPLQVFLEAFYGGLANAKKDSNLQKHLIEKWASSNIPAEVSACLLGFQLIKKASGIPMVILSDPKMNIADFRTCLSAWLATSGQSPAELFILPATAGPNPNAHFIDIIAAVMEKGSKQTSTGKINYPLVEGLSLNVPADLTPEQSQIYEQFTKSVWNDLQKTIGKIKSVVLEEGAENSGEITGAVVRGVAFNFGGTRDGDSQPSMASTTNALRERDRTQPFSPTPAAAKTAPQPKVANAKDLITPPSNTAQPKNS